MEGLFLPAEAEVAAAASLADRQHGRIRRAAEQQLPDAEASADAETSPLLGAAEHLQPVDAARHRDLLRGSPRQTESDLCG